MFINSLAVDEKMKYVCTFNLHLLLVLRKSYSHMFRKLIEGRTQINKSLSSIIDQYQKLMVNKLQQYM